MNYPQFDLEKALQGEPVAFHLDETTVVKGYLHASSLNGKDLMMMRDTLCGLAEQRQFVMKGTLLRLELIVLNYQMTSNSTISIFVKFEVCI